MYAPSAYVLKGHVLNVHQLIRPADYLDEQSRFEGAPGGEAALRLAMVQITVSRGLGER